jgi:hypothetical protein
MSMHAGHVSVVSAKVARLECVWVRVSSCALGPAQGVRICYIDTLTVHLSNSHAILRRSPEGAPWTCHPNTVLASAGYL